MTRSVQPIKHDNRKKQIERVADYLEQHPASTQKEIDAICDTGCISKVLSVMPRMGYGLRREWRTTVSKQGLARRLRTFTLMFRPSQQPDLFTPP
jgi:hypothetical protein